VAVRDGLEAVPRGPASKTGPTRKPAVAIVRRNRRAIRGVVPAVCREAGGLVDDYFSTGGTGDGGGVMFDMLTSCAILMAPSIQLDERRRRQVIKPRLSFCLRQLACIAKLGIQN